MKILVAGAALAAGGLFGLFQLSLLPKSWGPWVSKIYFWPTLPFTMLIRLDNYWTKMDGKRRGEYRSCMRCLFYRMAIHTHALSLEWPIGQGRILMSSISHSTHSYRIIMLSKLWFGPSPRSQPWLRIQDSCLFLPSLQRLELSPLG